MEYKRHAAPYPRLLGVFLFAIAMAPGLEAGEASGGTPALRPNKRAAESSSLEAGSPHKRPNVASLPPVANGGASQSVVGGTGTASAPDQGAFYDQVGGSSFDDRMHGRNRYFGRRPDFAALAAQFADFAALTITDSKGRVHVDWKSPAASAALTRALLRADYGLHWDLPSGFLCPPVPQRANYIHWIEDLLAGNTETTIKLPLAVGIPALATGLDIGVGASAIYPLLALSLHPEWKMIGTDINEQALHSARTNVEKNGLLPKIDLRLVRSDGRVLIDALKEHDGTLDFCMCNPPFFAAEESAHKAAHYRTCDANPDELVTPGGEAQFVRDMIADSHILQGKVRWYTTMVGHKASVAGAVAQIKGCGASVVRTTTFYQGKTIRWGVAWSYVAHEPRVVSLRFASDASPLTLKGKLDDAANKYGGFTLRWPSELEVTSCAPSASATISESPDADEERGDNAADNTDNETPAHARPTHTTHTHTSAVSYKAVARGQVFHESWTRRARRAKAVQEQETQSADTATTAVRHCDAALLDFVVVLVRLGVPGSAQEYASQAPCEMEAQEWLATVMLDQDAMAGVGADKGRLFDSLAAVLLRHLS